MSPHATPDPDLEAHRNDGAPRPPAPRCTVRTLILGAARKLLAGAMLALGGHVATTILQYLVH